MHAHITAVIRHCYSCEDNPRQTSIDIRKCPYSREPCYIRFITRAVLVAIDIPKCNPTPLAKRPKCLPASDDGCRPRLICLGHGRSRRSDHIARKEGRRESNPTFRDLSRLGVNGFVYCYREISNVTLLPTKPFDIGKPSCNPHIFCFCKLAVMTHLGDLRSYTFSVVVGQTGRATQSVEPCRSSIGLVENTLFN